MELVIGDWLGCFNKGGGSTSKCGNLVQTKEQSKKNKRRRKLEKEREPER